MSLRINGERRAETICQQCQKHFMGTIRFKRKFVKALHGVDVETVK